jgi:hypothetical protein
MTDPDYMRRCGDTEQSIAYWQSLEVADDDTPPPEPMRYAPGELSHDEE